MSDAVVRRESAAEYFKELVEGALAHQRIAAGELTSFYVVNLLTGFLQRPAEEDETPLAFRLAEALDAAGMRQRTSLKQIGDLSLFISGFFADSFHRKLVDVDYYVSIGGTAYTALEPVRDRRVFARLRRAGRQLRPVRRRAVRGQRTRLLRLQCRPAAALRTLAEDRQPPLRPAARSSAASCPACPPRTAASNSTAVIVISTVAVCAHLGNFLDTGPSTPEDICH